MTDTEKARAFVEEKFKFTVFPDTWKESLADDIAHLMNEARIDELEETAKKLQVNTWMDLFTGPLAWRIENSQIVIDWIRERAKKLRS